MKATDFQGKTLKQVLLKAKNTAVRPRVFRKEDGTRLFTGLVIGDYKLMLNKSSQVPYNGKLNKQFIKPFLDAVCSQSNTNAQHFWLNVDGTADATASSLV